MNDLDRRALIGTATLGVGLLAAFGAKAQTADWTAAEKANVDVVNSFLHALKPKDFSKSAAFLAPDCVYRMTETTPADRGPDAVYKRLAGWIDNADSIDFQIFATHALGPIVINHRMDNFNSKTNPLHFEGVGVFFIKGGKIQEWTDYSMPRKAA